MEAEATTPAIVTEIEVETIEIGIEIEIVIAIVIVIEIGIGTIEKGIIVHSLVDVSIKAEATIETLLLQKSRNFKEGPEEEKKQILK